MKGWVGKAAVGVMLLGGFCGVFAATEAMAVLGTDSCCIKEHPPSPIFGDPAMVMRVLETQAIALESMRVGRTFALVTLSMACAMAAVSAARLLRPRGLPREPLRRMIGIFCIAAALLRSVDGAQAAAVARRVGAEVGATLSAPPDVDAASLQQLREMMPSLMVGLVAVQTAVVAGTFLLLGQFFRSQRARDEIAALDA